MIVKKIMTSERVCTTVDAERVCRLADECGVVATLVDSVVRQGQKWMNDFEVEGPSGRVETFLIRLRDVEVS
ncbi:hypothetical protein [Propionispora sp. 2/2-37]|uniref:hypothetical protein n=1 Tax=Propionispora sp. 2/2-37 TaxID=1677858 RepID=UPI0006BB7D1F|nr:hypothetical protein [Propionispora sp. 2/2-37]